jgi:hypothetical protein
MRDDGAMQAGLLAIIGAGCFGLVVGWITYRTLMRSRGGQARISDLATVIGVIGGGVVVALFDDPDLFAGYAIGLAIGFFAYLALTFALQGRDTSHWHPSE